MSESTVRPGVRQGEFHNVAHRRREIEQEKQHRSGDMKVREVIKLIEADGWSLDRTSGAHRQFKHPTKPGVVTVSGKPSKDIPPGTLNNILKQAGLKGDNGP